MEPTKEQITELDRADLTWLNGQPLEVKLDIMQNHLIICRLIANQIMEEEVIGLAGQRYSRDKPHGGRYSRWASNPGSIRVGDQRVSLKVPRVRDMESSRCVGLDTYEQMREQTNISDQIVQGILKGLSTRDYRSVIDHAGEGFGLSKSQVSEQFVRRTSQDLDHFMNRDLSMHTFVALFIDGKTLGGQQIIIALGVTEQGKKIPIDFIQAHSEHSGPVSDMLRRMQKRGVNLDEVLFIVDGSKGFHKAIKSVCGEQTPIQRCTWHKLENIKSYLPEKDHALLKSDFYHALDRETYEDAKTELLQLEQKLRLENISAANSLLEGVEEILTLHQLGINRKLWKSFRSTNCIENLNSQMGKYLNKVKYWQNSDQRHRWVAAALLEVENNMRKISNYRLLPLLRKAILLHHRKGTSSPNFN